jgi:hypothetical protein
MRDRFTVRASSIRRTRTTETARTSLNHPRNKGEASEEVWLETLREYPSAAIHGDEGAVASALATVPQRVMAPEQAADLPRIVKRDKRYKDGRPHEAVETEALQQTVLVDILRTLAHRSAARTAGARSRTRTPPAGAITQCELSPQPAPSGLAAAAPGGTTRVPMGAAAR